MTWVLTEQVPEDLLWKCCRLLAEKRRRDLLLLLAKLRRGDMALRTVLPSSWSSSLSSSSCFSSEGPHTSSTAPWKDRRRLPTQPVTCSWAAASFPPKYCMWLRSSENLSWCLGHHGNGGSPEKRRLGFVRDEEGLRVSPEPGVWSDFHFT